MNKLYKFLGTTAILVSAGGTFTPILANAAVTTAPSSQIADDEKAVPTTQQLSDIAKALNASAIAKGTIDSGNIIPNSQLGALNLTGIIGVASQNKDQVVSTQKKLFKTVPITNSSPEADAVYTIPQFTHEVSNSVTTTSDVAMNSAEPLTTGVNISLPENPEGLTSLAATFDFATNTPVESKETETWQIASQKTNVQANHSVEVNYYTSDTTTTGTFDLKKQISADIPYSKDPATEEITTIPIGKVFKDKDNSFTTEDWNNYAAPSSILDNWQYVNDKTADYVVGKGTYTAKYVTQVTVEVFDKTANKVLATYQAKLLPK